MNVLITGGAASGKSELAEALCGGATAGRKFYIATMVPDESAKSRIEKHRQRRAEMNFVTIERPLALAQTTFPEQSVVLLECLTNLVANEQFLPGGAGEETVEAVLSGIRRLAAAARYAVFVTGEVFSDGNRYDASTTQYLRNLGEVNRRCAELCDVVVEAVCGIPVVRKGSLA